jgi:hypothetical protein
MSLILLDNAARGTTTLLSSCVPSTTSDQLQDGTTPGDGTGDTGFNFGRKIKQWAADQNVMNAQIFGSYLAATLAAGAYANWDPTQGTPGNVAAISRIDVNPVTGNVTLSGLVATNITDEKRILVRNSGSVTNGYTVTLRNLNSGSTSANQFAGPGEDLIIVPGQAVEIIYYLIVTPAIAYWVIKP